MKMKTKKKVATVIPIRAAGVFNTSSSSEELEVVAAGAKIESQRLKAENALFQRGIELLKQHPDAVRICDLPEEIQIAYAQEWEKFVQEWGMP